MGRSIPQIALRLGNLALLLKAMNRMEEAEPLMRRAVDIFATQSLTTGHVHPHLQPGVDYYTGLLFDMGWTEDEVRARVREIAPEVFAEG